MTRTRAVKLALAALAVVALYAAWRVPGGMTSIDPVALKLLPPGTRIVALVGVEGDLHPVAGWSPDGPGVRSFEWSVDGDAVSFRRGPRVQRIALDKLARDRDGRPRTVTLWYPLGTDQFGRDFASRIARGSLVSLGIGLGGALLAGVLAAFIGIAAAFGGRLADLVLSAIGDLVLAIPRVLLVMALAAVLRPGVAGIALLLGLTGWPAIARLVRTEARVLLESEIVAAGRAAGASPARLMRHHVFPQLLDLVLVAVALRVGPFLLLEASLSFLGFGVAPPMPSWGNAMADGRAVMFDGAWVAIIPGVCVALAVLAANVAADRARQPRGAPAGDAV